MKVGASTHAWGTLTNRLVQSPPTSISMCPVRAVAFMRMASKLMGSKVRPEWQTDCHSYEDWAARRRPVRACDGSETEASDASAPPV